MAAKRGTATAVEPVLILPDALYTSQQVMRLLGVCKSTLREARQSQGLVASRRAGRDWYFGSDLLAWLRGGRCSRSGADAVEGTPAPVAFHRASGETDNSQQNKAREGR